MWLANRMSMKQKDAFSSFCRFYALTPPSRAHLDLEGWNLQYNGHARLQAVPQAGVLVQREDAEGNVLASYASAIASRPTQHGVHHLQQQSGAAKQRIGCSGLVVTPTNGWYEVDVGVEKVPRVAADDEGCLLEELDAVGGGGARVDATLVVVSTGNDALRRLHEGEQALEQRRDEVQ